MMENATTALHGMGECDHVVDGSGDHMEDEFYNLTMLLVFLLATWLVGKLAMKIKIPSLVGEMVVGMVLGPELLNVVPFPLALTLVGEVGLLLLVLEAGLEVDLAMLKQIGGKGLVVAVVGSALPLGIGTALAFWVARIDIIEAFAVGASLAPTSMAIALNILKVGKQLHTPCGQLIIAAAVIDDVVALILLSMIKALQNDPLSPTDFVIPIASSAAFTLAIGGFAVVGMPRLTKIPVIKKHSESETFVNIAFFTLFLLAIGLMNATFYGKSSFLLGAFLAGLCFCTVGKIQAVWHSQVKRIETWMLRIFFSCSVAFKVPVKDLWTLEVVGFAALLLVALLGKVVTGVFGPSPPQVLFPKPTVFFTIGCAMSAWGEFAFVVANTSLDLGIMKPDTFASVVLAVVASAVISPWALSLTLLIAQKERDRIHHELNMSVRRTGAEHKYLEVDICCVNRWGLVDGLIDKFHKLDLSVLDFTCTTLDKYSISRLYLLASSRGRGTADITSAISEYCGIPHESDDDFGVLPESPIPSAVFKQEDLQLQDLELYPCMSIRPWMGKNSEGEPAEMQESLHKFTKRVNSARKLSQRSARSESFVEMQNSIIRSAQQ